MSDATAGLYASEALQAVTGETVRPGGYDLTRRAVEFCGLATGSRLLDVGCGTGASVELLIGEYRLDAVGVDPTGKMLELGRRRCATLPIFPGSAEALAFAADRSFDVILTECSLSQCADIQQALREFNRVLAPGGWLIVSDLYIRQSSEPADASRRNGLMEMDVIHHLFASHGFEIVLHEDHTDKLIQLKVDTIMAYGSAKAFWEKVGGCGAGCDLHQEAGKRYKLGYYLLIAKNIA